MHIFFAQRILRNISGNDFQRHGSFFIPPAAQGALCRFSWRARCSYVGKKEPHSGGGRGKGGVQNITGVGPFPAIVVETPPATAM